MIHGIDVVLYEVTQTGVDEFRHPVYSEEPVTVKNVLVTPVSSDQALSELNLTGKKIVYELSIPKDDTHVWEDRKVAFFGETFRAYDFRREWIDDLVPLSWNGKVKVERYG